MQDASDEGHWEGNCGKGAGTYKVTNQHDCRGLVGDQMLPCMSTRSFNLQDQQKPHQGFEHAACRETSSVHTAQIVWHRQVHSTCSCSFHQAEEQPTGTFTDRPARPGSNAKEKAGRNMNVL